MIAVAGAFFVVHIGAAPWHLAVIHCETRPVDHFSIPLFLRAFYKCPFVCRVAGNVIVVDPHHRVVFQRHFFQHFVCSYLVIDALRRDAANIRDHIFYIPSFKIPVRVPFAPVANDARLHTEKHIADQFFIFPKPFADLVQMRSGCFIGRSACDSVE